MKRRSHFHLHINCGEVENNLFEAKGGDGNFDKHGHRLPGVEEFKNRIKQHIKTRLPGAKTIILTFNCIILF
jgi:hypothetical protein